VQIITQGRQVKYETAIKMYNLSLIKKAHSSITYFGMIITIYVTKDLKNPKSQFLYVIIFL